MINETPAYRVDHMPYGGNRWSGLGREGILPEQRIIPALWLGLNS